MIPSFTCFTWKHNNVHSTPSEKTSHFAWCSSLYCLYAKRTKRLLHHECSSAVMEQHPCFPASFPVNKAVTKQKELCVFVVTLLMDVSAWEKPVSGWEFFNKNPCHPPPWANMTEEFCPVKGVGVGHRKGMRQNSLQECLLLRKKLASSNVFSLSPCRLWPFCRVLAKWRRCGLEVFKVLEAEWLQDSSSFCLPFHFPPSFPGKTSTLLYRCVKSELPKTWNFILMELMKTTAGSTRQIEGAASA